MAVNLKKENIAIPGIGWGGSSLKSMLEESEALFAETGLYYGTDKLEIREKDPIRYERIFSRIRGGIVNARATALNISASPIVKEIGELCFALYTPEGDSIALSTGIIVHVHTMSDTIKYMIRNEYEKNPKIRPGDVFGNNDTMIGDVHNADVFTIIPIFLEGELIGWAGGVTHEIDVGTGNPGSMAFGQTSRYEDGFIVSAEKIGENDELLKSYEMRAAKAVRASMYWLLDERTRLAGCQMIRDEVLRLIEDEGIDTYKKFIREVIEEGRSSFKARVKEVLFPGKYRVPSFMEVPFAGETNIKKFAAKDQLMHSPLEITIGDDGKFSISLEGASKWGYHSFNCGPSAIQGAVWVQLTQHVVAGDKVNDGAYFATEINLPYGSWANPDNHLVSTTLAWIFLVQGFTGLPRSLCRAFFTRGYLEEGMAGYPNNGNMIQGGGPNQYGIESAFTNFEMSCQGTAARILKDGEGYCAAMWNPEGDMGDVESWEMMEPLLYLGRRVKPNTPGYGKYRGGPGFESLRMVWKTPVQELFQVGEGKTFSGPGVFGGYPGNSGYRHNLFGTNLKEIFANQLPYPTHEADTEDSEINQLVRCESETFDDKALACAVTFGEYDLYLSVERGAPGLGDPIERDPEAVEQDLNDDFLLPRYAERVYGAELERTDTGKWHVDPMKTAARREMMRKERAAKAVPVSEFIKQERERILTKDMIPAVTQMYRESMTLSESWANFFKEFWNLPTDFTF